MLFEYTGVICSLDKKKVYCLERSFEFKGKGDCYGPVDILWIHSCYITPLLHKGVNPQKWDVKDILNLMVEECIIRDRILEEKKFRNENYKDNV